MPRIKMTKSNIDALPIGKSDIVYWDVGRPGFGVKVTPKGRKVFVVLYRTGGAAIAANKTLKTLKTFLRWCVGRAVLDRSPADGVPLPAKEISRDRVLTDDELARVIIAARQIGGAYGGIVELLALTAQRREEVAGASSDEL